jgi:hypothetical protein
MAANTYMSGAVRAAAENQALDDRRVDGAPGDLAFGLQGNILSVAAQLPGS